MSQFFLDEIPTCDMRTLRNVDIAACEIETGVMGTPPNRASLIAQISLRERLTEVVDGQGEAVPPANKEVGTDLGFTQSNIKTRSNQR